MSTDMQECSIENQAIVIQRYAEANGFKILKTYEDAAKSGLTITQRKGLQSNCQTSCSIKRSSVPYLSMTSAGGAAFKTLMRPLIMSLFAKAPA